MKVVLEKLQIKKILITNYYLDVYTGSPLVTLDIAKLFRSHGVDVDVAGFIVKDPVASLFRDIGVNIIDPIKEPQRIFKKSYDLVWGHHWAILGFVLFELNIKTKYLVISSLSSFVPFETIWMLMEESDLILFHSIRNREISGFDKHRMGQKVQVLCNSLTEDWFSTKEKQPKNLQKIAIISNHVPQELKEAIHLLNIKNIEVSVIGLEYKQELITPQRLDDFDAIITIGHSVQKALARGIPVYCYDRFGGPGWITTENIDNSEDFNFSGRCCNRKLSSHEIAAEIANGFAFAQKQSFLSLAIKRYSLSRNVENLLKLLQPSSRYQDFSGFLTERKICQAFVNAQFGNVVSPLSTLVGTKKELLHVSVEQHCLEESQVYRFFLDPIEPYLWVYDTDTERPFTISGVFLAKQSYFATESIYCVFGDQHIFAQIGLHSPGLGNQFPKIPFSYSSRFFIKTPSPYEISLIELFAQSKNHQLIKLATIRLGRV